MACIAFFLFILHACVNVCKIIWCDLIYQRVAKDYLLLTNSWGSDIRLLHHCDVLIPEVLDWNTYVFWSLLTEEGKEHAYDNGDDENENVRAKQPQYYHSWNIQGKTGEKHDDDDDDDDCENFLLLVSETSSVDLFKTLVLIDIYNMSSINCSD